MSYVATDTTDNSPDPGKASAADLQCNRIRDSRLEEFVSALICCLSSRSAPPMANTIADLVRKRLARPGMTPTEGAVGGPPPIGLRDTVRRAVARGTDLSRIAISLAHYAQVIFWRRGRSGSVIHSNIEMVHSYGIIIGPGGVEDRADVHLGVTYLESYSWLPDHFQRQPHALLLISPAELSLDGRNWFPAGAGTVFANEAGQRLSLRCGAHAVLAVWCRAEEMK